MLLKWSAFALNHKLPDLQRAHTWSFSAIYKETPEAIARVKRQGYDVVEMEAATLYAIGQEKGVETLSLFVISDQVSRHEWRPLLKEPIVSTHLHQLADWAFTFCQEIADQ